MVSFVGAGPGAADLITVRGAGLLAQADVVVYAGSLVNPELLELCPEGCETHDSSQMTLPQIVDVMAQAHRDGRRCVRLHTGDPSLFGAIREQMDELDALGVPYEMVPGVSSLFGAAAALRAEYTVPGVSQSLIVTRMEGRTPVPARERLRELAGHGCTMALFLSAGLLEGVQDELVRGGYDPSAPAAIVVRASWPDEAVYRCTVGTLARCGREHGVARSALVLVGDVLGPGGDRSRLYDPSFSHGWRRASAEPGE
ncbi:MAG: precorrin-4 C(11)-methyltransferase [Coriobacteriales bacterium]|nr:precorrin-4 C(11)-methyltransferase [Coriobacteriales bacterium]